MTDDAPSSPGPYCNHVGTYHGMTVVCALAPHPESVCHESADFTWYSTDANTTMKNPGPDAPSPATDAPSPRCGAAGTYRGTNMTCWLPPHPPGTSHAAADFHWIDAVAGTSRSLHYDVRGPDAPSLCPDAPSLSCPDTVWAPVARDSREAMRLLGWTITVQCLPDEPTPCGARFCDHAGAHLAVIRAIADHQLSHLGMPEEMIDVIYHDTQAKLRADHA